ncbi:MAG TPA: GNAT family N-acetyltransferase [Nitrosopumilus sp.]|jgi:glucosamine-phosphate N-acetyltransferase|nr:GNAT family N-acetyltransferase [Nitrosopumilus sp.]HJL67386.1 GNAT family N-acetyltransferase [Nitrosopumilus sp.]HJM25580.1 GNAT family N-acetyltransferase [Nitrosopumilus sp.]HJO31526.1 GNAT family N-acetyltransferase [Nitrosopumilus sp.]|tara:strand:- start:1578 stop:2015 length:438 start_codon:yes stop_codon:yes gene_type:complete
MRELKIRELQKEDLQKGFLTTLDSLRITSNIDKNKAEEVFEKINSNPNHIIAIAELDEKIIGSATLLIEPKFIHDGGLVGHIEDVVVDKNFQGQKIGNEIIKFLLEFAKNQGCYKTILNCTDDVKEFYEKVGFTLSANELRFNHI